METLPQVQTAVGSALVSLGDGNWKMGEGVQVGKAAKAGESDESVILEHFICKHPKFMPPSNANIESRRCGHDGYQQLEHTLSHFQTTSHCFDLPPE